jgi:hypothetical protein
LSEPAWRVSDHGGDAAKLAGRREAFGMRGYGWFVILFSW